MLLFALIHPLKEMFNKDNMIERQKGLEAELLELGMENYRKALSDATMEEYKS